MKYWFLVCAVFFSTIADSQLSESIWVDSLMNSMTLDEKLGQLFMIRAYSNRDEKHYKEIDKLIKEEKIGGLCFFQGTPKKQAELTNRYQKKSSLPMLISVDAEWGLGMRFKENGFSFPKQMMLGAMSDAQGVYQMGKMVADHCQRMGIHINFAPVVDVNNNPDNPVINYRSFGEDKYNVAVKSAAYMKGMQDGGIIACAKHFPGHGDTDVDSHYDLPIINHNRARLDSLELMPFRAIIKDSIQSIMVAHLHVPSLDDRKNRATTLSEKTVTSLLKNELNYDGLIITDALDMQGVAKHFEPGVVDAEAFKAGNDILLLSENVKKAKAAIIKYIVEEKLSEQRVNESVRKILIAKYRQGLYATPIIENPENLEAEIKSWKAQNIRQSLIESSLTLVKNDLKVIPLSPGSQAKIATLSLGSKENTVFQNRVGNFIQASHFHFGKNISSSAARSMIKQLSSYDQIIVSLHDLSQYSSKNFGLTPSMLSMIEDLGKEKEVLLVHFGSPYALKYFDSLETVLVAYQEDEDIQDAAAQALFGVTEINGKLPVTASEVYQVGLGLYSPSIGVLGYARPEYVQLSADSLMAIDTIISEMIEEKAAPGCQVLIAKNGRIVHHEAYGYHTYDKKRRVKLDDLYDVASVTKTLATTISTMKLEESGQIQLEDSLSQHIANLDTCQIRGLQLRDVLAHHAGLRGWIAFYESTMTDDKKPQLNDTFYRTAAVDSFNILVAPKVYLRDDYRDSIWHRIHTCSIRDTNDYKYSDLGFYMLSEIIQSKTGQELNDYAHNTFYNPLGLQHTTFKPLEKFPSKQITPSEDDTYFRMQKIQGYVHDMGAAMLGGVSGHAGLFSISKELGVLMQMLLNGGHYGNQQYLRPETILKYTTRHPRSTRRGLGFDMKELDEDKTLNISEKCSPSTFGHLGFTGTSVYADPEHDIIYIFLSNRTYPSMENRKFGRNEYRPRVQTVIYDAMIKKD